MSNVNIKVIEQKNIKINETSYPEFISLCKKTQEQLKKRLDKRLKKLYPEVINEDGYLFAKGEVPVLLVAHMDTVHKNVVKTFSEELKNGKHIISSIDGIGGDDRCGIYMIMEIIKTHKCSVLFCEDEEIGCVGATLFSNSEHMNKLKDIKYIIELDRKGNEDAVFYQCDNPEFTEFIEKNTGYKEDWGSYTDICDIAPVLGVAAVNLSCGYYNAHMTTEYVVMEEMFHTIDVVKKLLDVECEQFKYIKKKYASYGGRGFGNYNHYNYYDDYVYYYDKYYRFLYTRPGDEETHLYIAKGKNMKELYGDFLMNTKNVCMNDIIVEEPMYLYQIYANGEKVGFNY